MDEQRFLTESELLEALRVKVDRTAVWRWRKKGMPHVKIGKAIRYDLAAVQEWLAKQVEAMPYETYFTGYQVDDVVGAASEFTMGLRRGPGGVEQLLEIKARRKSSLCSTEADFRQMIVMYLKGMAETIESGDVTVVFKDLDDPAANPKSEEG
jgi:predicted DNA-binding transcriptional regulator AlpA